MCGEGVRIADNEMITTFDPMEGVHQNFIGLQHINMSAVAKVCGTDILTVQSILKEIIAQLVYQLKKGNNVRLVLKIGKLISRGGELQWKSFVDDEYAANKAKSSRNNDFASVGASTNYSRAMVNSVQRKELSVFTPSI